MDELSKLNDELIGAPGGVLVMLFAVALGYLLKTLPVVNNRYIPLYVVVACTIGFMLLAPSRSTDMPARIYHTRNFLIGFVLGIASWILHAQVLKRFIDPYFFNQDGSTKFFAKKPTDDNQSP